jgi:hypothetical protein
VWAYFAAPAIAVVCLIVTLAWGSEYGLGLRDPDGIIGRRFVFIVVLIAGFWALDVIPRAIRRDGERGLPARLVAIGRERWPLRRVVFVLGSIVAFYVTYLCYRNLKSYLPLARPELFDQQLTDLERGIFGRDPALLLQELLGTGVAAHVLSAVYLLFLTFVPLSVGATLVWSSDRASALWWVSVLSIAWVLGTVSYFLSIAAFASLHIAIVFAGALMAHLLRAPRPIRIGMWLYLALTLPATIYFGWHYVIDDLAGFVIGFVSVYLGALLTGWRIERTSTARAFQVQSA